MRAFLEYFLFPMSSKASHFPNNLESFPGSTCTVRFTCRQMTAALPQFTFEESVGGSEVAPACVEKLSADIRPVGQVELSATRNHDRYPGQQERILHSIHSLPFESRSAELAPKST